MKKSLFKSATTGILIGLLISIIVSYIWAPNYQPLNPYSAVGQWMLEHDIHGSLVLVYSASVWAAIGILFYLANFFFKQTDWSLLRATLTHYAFTCLGFIPLASLAGWFPLNTVFYLQLLVEFSIIYLVVWTISYWKMKRDISRLNQYL